MVKGYRDYSRSMMLAQLELRQDLSFLTEGLTFRVMTNTTRNAYFDVARQYKPFYYEMLGIDRSGDYLLNILNEETGEEYLDYNEGRKTVNSVFYLESALNYNHTFRSEEHTSELKSLMRISYDV